MANDLNDYKCIGRLGRDPELKYFASGDAYVNISLAVGKQWKDKQSGEKKEATTWVPFVFTGKLAEIVGQYCKKGSQVYAAGEFSVRKYQKDGADHYATEIRGNSIQLLGGKPEGAGGQSAAPAQRQQAPAQKAAGGGFDDMDSDVPF